MPPIRTRFRALIVISLLVALFAPAAAHANANQLSIMMDDNLLLYRGDSVRDAALKKMKSLGVDAVRVTVLWSVVAQDDQKTPARAKRFKKLGESNPKAYPTTNWDRYDRLDRACQTLQITCYFDVTGPGPLNTNAKPPKADKKDAAFWMPNPRHFYNFVQAVGTRYSGKYHDEDDNHVTLPRITMWSLWNEPNQGGWLRPQWFHGKPYSPIMYRDLYLFGHRALVSTGHGNDVILAGETAPTGVARHTTTSAIDPTRFITQVLCGPGSLSRVGCTDFDKYGPLTATAWAHHPYTKKLGPTQRDPSPGAITMANFGDLGTLLDKLAASTGHIKSGMPLISTEFGFETNPPDPFTGIAPALQAQYIEIGDLLSYLNPRVIGNTQFLLQDVAPVKTHPVGSRAYWSTYQSGLLNVNGSPKIAAAVYAFPFIAGVTDHDPTTGAPIFSYYGQLRFRPHGVPDGTDSVQLQFKPADGSADWAAFGDPIPVSGARGFFTGSTTAPGAGQIRAVWSGSSSPYSATSPEQSVG